MDPKTAVKVMLWMLGAIILFHLSIILKIVPYEITWGGRLKNDTEMYVFETISIVINLFLIFSLLIKGKYMKAFISAKKVDIALWIFLGIFALNTLGNIFAETNFEKSFTLVTLAFTLLIWIILRKDNKSIQKEQ